MRILLQTSTTFLGGSRLTAVRRLITMTSLQNLVVCLDLQRDSPRSAAQMSSAAPAPAKAQTPPHPQRCPHCGQTCYKPRVFYNHMMRCCRDLLFIDATDGRRHSREEGMGGDYNDSDIIGAFETGDTDAIALWLRRAELREESLRRRSLDVAFRQRDDQGNPVRLGAEEIAKDLNVPLPRAERLLRFAMRAVPLPADTDPVEVIYEDDMLIAVNKPAGVITAPKHRYVGGSIVNRLKGHMQGLEPAVLHRLDMHTTGVLLFAKDRVREICFLFQLTMSCKLLRLSACLVDMHAE
jgi:hypothetical protein